MLGISILLYSQSHSYMQHIAFPSNRMLQSSTMSVCLRLCRSSHPVATARSPIIAVPVRRQLLQLERRFHVTPMSSACCSPSSSSSDKCCSSPGACTSTEPLTIRQKCDPYGQNGNPLPEEKVIELKRQVHDDWKYNKEKEELSIVLSFRSPDNDPAKNISALFEFVSRLGNIAVNQGHSPKSINLLPNRAQVEITMRTPALKGLSFADFNYAMYADGAVKLVKSKWKLQ